jgi:hypothetical protein
LSHGHSFPWMEPAGPTSRVPGTSKINSGPATSGADLADSESPTRYLPRIGDLFDPPPRAALDVKAERVAAATALRVQREVSRDLMDRVLKGLRKL